MVLQTLRQPSAQTHTTSLCSCVPLACHGILKSAGSQFLLFTLKFILSSFFVTFPDLNQLLPPDFSLSEMGLPHILSLCLSTSFSLPLGLAFGSSMPKMPFRPHSCNSTALALWTDRLRESCKSQGADCITGAAALSWGLHSQSPSLKTKTLFKVLSSRWSYDGHRKYLESNL